MRAAVIIPVFNHGRTVVRVVREALELGFPVFVVNDGSTEPLPPFPEELAAVHCLQHRANQGKGAALETGMRAAAGSADWAITIDADGQHNPRDAKELLAAIGTGQRPIVVGSRRGMKAAPWTSRSGREFSNFWVWVSGGPRLSDSQSGFRVYPIPETLKLGVRARRYQYEIEVLVKARWQGLPVIEAPVEVAYRTDIPRISHFHPFLDFLRNTGTFSRLITRRVFTPGLWKTSFYKSLMALSRICGPWLFSLVAKGIAAGYFLFCPGRVKVGLAFYTALFPDRSRAYHLWYTWRQFQNFTSLFLDRFRLQEEGGIQYTFQGEEMLQAIIDKGKGGILLMSHMGNWEVAARLLQKNLNGLRLLLYMGARAGQEIENLQKETVTDSGIDIVGVDESGGSPLDIIEGVRFLRTGGIVSMAGDVLWRDNQAAVETTFLGKQIRLPEAPFALAMASGAPLVVFFALRTGQGQYHFQAAEPIWIDRTDRKNRSSAIQAAADRYARHLEDAVKANPCQWYHFEPFLGTDSAAINHR